MSSRGLSSTGRPAFLITALANISSVSSGRSSYSDASTTCASNFFRSLFKERTVFVLLTWIRLSHTKNMPRIAALRIANNHHPTLQCPETNNPNFFVIFSSVLDFDGLAVKHNCCVFEAKPTSLKRISIFCRVKCDFTPIVVSTSLPQRKRVFSIVARRRCK